ncbi:DMT family transporter [Siculibacillus lacustris]|uniref:DMT family transporter n=1 Tax=Siculibacillus lacustris TaxID=1549641 RepID=UPI001D18FF67|nr:DMT family transporter [Siculibacillus lacustris]
MPPLALAALLAAAVAMGVSPVFVREAGVGPFTSAFYRVFLALPALAAWAAWERRAPRSDGTPVVDPGWTRSILLAGVFFTVDLFFWHLAVLHTTIANATLLATMAPVWVMLFSLVIGERVTAAMTLGLAICVVGGALLVGSSWHLAPERLLGDLYGVATSVGFGLYFLAVRVARRTASTGIVLLRSTVVTAALLGIVAAVAENRWIPGTLGGVLALLAMANVSHVGGQGLLGWALGHLSAAFSSLVIFLEALAAAFFGWILFGETLGPWQFAGGAAILLGIWIARPREETPR